jgi:hypothetical protein
VIEYGSGRSTAIIAQAGHKVFTVETDWSYFLEVIDQLEDEILNGLVWPFYYDVGPVLSWGYPATSEDSPRHLRYGLYPWIQSRRLKEEPGMVILDGRFRVATFFTSYQRAAVGTLILFNDYYSRSSYHVVRALGEEEFAIGDLSVFRVTLEGKSMFNDETGLFFLEHLSMFLDPR